MQLNWEFSSEIKQPFIQDNEDDFINVLSEEVEQNEKCLSVLIWSRPVTWNPWSVAWWYNGRVKLFVSYRHRDLKSQTYRGLTAQKSQEDLAGFERCRLKSVQIKIINPNWNNLESLTLNVNQRSTVTYYAIQVEQAK